MKFKTVAEAFNFYKGKTLEEIEKRAAEIKQTIATDPAADVDALNIEAEGMEQAAAELRQDPAPAGVEFRGFKILESMNLETRGSYEAIEGDVFASAEYRSAFYKKLMGKDLNSREKAAFERAQQIVTAEHRTDAFNTVTNSAAVIPTQTLNEVVRKARKEGGLLSVVRSFAMPTRIAIPVGTPSDKAAWHVEGAPVTTENNIPTLVTFGAYEIIKIFSMSAATKTMSISAFESYLTDELVACVMECIADALVNGTGSGQGTGLLTGITWTTGTNAIEADATDGITYADVVGTVALLKRGYAGGAKWAMNNATLYNTFYGMLDGNKRPIFIADPKGEEVGKILGKEVVVDDNLPDDTIIFGNFNYMAYNMPQGVVIEVSRESSFKSGLIDYRALAIADCKPVVAEAFVKLTVGE